MTNGPRRIPYVDLARQNVSVLDESLAAVRRVLEHGQMILGPEVAALEEAIADYLGVRHVVGVNSGTDALILALRVHGVGPDDEVIVPSHTFLATAAAICSVGATPVFADVDPATMVVCPDRVAALVSGRTAAIVAVHLNGYPCDMPRLEALARHHGIALIEDAAQCLGARRGERMAGSWGTGCFSMHPLKILGAAGDAGFVATTDATVADELRRARNLGLQSRDEAVSISGNSRLDTIQAAMLLTKLPHLEDWIEARNAHARAIASVSMGSSSYPWRSRTFDRSIVRS